MGDWEIAVVAHLESLTKAARAFWEKDGQEDYFETELVRAEDFLEEVVGDADLRV